VFVSKKVVIKLLRVFQIHLVYVTGVLPVDV